MKIIYLIQSKLSKISLYKEICNIPKETTCLTSQLVTTQTITFITWYQYGIHINSDDFL